MFHWQIYFFDMYFRYVREWIGCMTAAEIVSITDDNKYFIPEACKPYLELSYLASAMPTIAQNQKECINCFKKDGPKGINIVSADIQTFCLSTC